MIYVTETEKALDKHIKDLEKEVEELEWLVSPDRTKDYFDSLRAIDAEKDYKKKLPLIEKAQKLLKIIKKINKEGLLKLSDRLNEKRIQLSNAKQEFHSELYRNDYKRHKAGEGTVTPN